jgi:hypothetical protein
MEASVTIDIINRAKFEICAREDCPNPVKKEIKTGPKKIYCDALCGHIVASRKARALKRLARTKQLQGGFTAPGPAHKSIVRPEQIPHVSNS